MGHMSTCAANPASTADKHRPFPLPPLYFIFCLQKQTTSAYVGQNSNSGGQLSHLYWLPQLHQDLQAAHHQSEKLSWLGPEQRAPCALPTRDEPTGQHSRRELFVDGIQIN